jgi:DNA modification methylase
LVLDIILIDIINRKIIANMKKLDNSTNEENRIESYSNSIPTNPSAVNEETPLNLLNLNWKERDLPERIRTKHVHRLHPYLGKFIPQLVEIFLRKYFKSGQTILDPFCGSGTTLVQANELGINSIGYDISAFNVLLSKAKTHKYDIDLVKFEIHDALSKIQASIKTDGTEQLELWERKADEIKQNTSSQYLFEWFSSNALSELLTYREIISKNNYKYSDLLKIILSRSARSSRLVRHFDLEFPKSPQKEPYQCYKHSRECYPVQEAFKFIKRYSIDTVKRVSEYSLIQTDAVVDVRHENSISANFPKIDGLITSPPYVGLIDYHQQHIYAYELFGLKDKRDEEIGPASSGKSLQAKNNYKIDLAKVFKNAAKKMRKDGVMIIIAGDRHNLYEDIADDSGLIVEDVVKRHVNRRTGRRSTEFFESVFIWRKK